jgi:hypothetical protein
MNKITATHKIEAGRINPKHEITDPAKLARLIANLEENGWTGRPLLVAYDGDGYYAMTGTHRLAAALATDTLVPVLLMDNDDLQTLCSGRDATLDEINGLRDEDLLAVLEASPLSSDYENLMKAEVDANLADWQIAEFQAAATERYEELAGESDETLFAEDTEEDLLNYIESVGGDAAAAGRRYAVSAIESREPSAEYSSH